MKFSRICKDIYQQIGRLILTFSLTLFACTTQATQILLINPDQPGRPFWDLTTEVAKAAANNLNIKLDVKYGGGDRFANHKLISNISTKYDYVIFMPHRGKAAASFEQLTDKGVHFITLERAIDKTEFKQVGKPQEKYPLWLAEVYYDDWQAGKLLGSALLKQSKNHGELQPNILAFNGDHSSLSEQRADGLITSANQYQAQIKQVFYTFWNPTIAKQQIRKAIQRYPNSNVIWAASDQIAIAISQELKLLATDKNWIIGGIDWSIDAIEAVKKQRISATVGGHFMQAAWAIIMAYDHSMGLDVGHSQAAMPLSHQLITQDNAKHFHSLWQSKIWHCINFKQFSLALNRNQTYYQFDFERLVTSNTANGCL
ncbi:hypothetical protein C2869_05805 [Saccharobesus litoralis]|uniref:Periplasmic binding protein domain-containing protein n=1 Tax=Saccharobesus litoralis TaxID=2172099 RepID=A0A2S0VP66_9ALTE|nr:ABC transporter substrate-binding protein [Saccharobesus litoralis]AWB65983.1 hypothetical protein C2869_05805 [Saccharobesus litoralis]